MCVLCYHNGYTEAYKIKYLYYASDQFIRGLKKEVEAEFVVYEHIISSLAVSAGVCSASINMLKFIYTPLLL